MVGNCPIFHDSTVSNFTVKKTRQEALEGIHGSSFMKQSLSGANKAQSDSIPSKQDRTELIMQAIKQRAPMAKKPKAAEPWLYTLK